MKCLKRCPVRDLTQHELVWVGVVFFPVPIPWATSLATAARMSSDRNHSASAMRILLRIISALAAIAYTALLVVASRVGSVSDGSGTSSRNYADLVMLFPLLYFSACFCNSFAKRRSSRLLAVGIGANTLLAVFAVAMCFAGSTGWIGLAPAAIFVMLWVGMYPEPGQFRFGTAT